MYESLTDDDLIHSYLNAVDMELDQDFIELLYTEIERRKLQINLDTLNEDRPPLVTIGYE